MRQPVSPITRIRRGDGFGSGSACPSTAALRAPAGRGAAQTVTGKFPPSLLARTRIGSAPPSTISDGHVVSSAMTRTSALPPGTSSTQAVAAALESDTDRTVEHAAASHATAKNATTLWRFTRARDPALIPMFPVVKSRAA